MVGSGFVGLRLPVGFDMYDDMNRCGEAMVEGVFHFMGNVVTLGNRNGRVDSDGCCDTELVAMPPRS